MPDSPTADEGQSTPRVIRLPDDLANQIAAGEVVERPASAVKELVENAVDAGATRIHVELADGGLSLIRVTDNGRGMDRDDATLAIERHATSKLIDRAGLFAISTLGFRGEAIPSIASVSRFELLTKPHNTLGGTRITIEGGTLQSIDEAGAPPGTTITVRDLFFNTPARLKFLKTRQTELKHVQETLLRTALAHPHIALGLTHNNRNLLDLPANQDPADRIFLVFGEHDSEHLYPLLPAEQDGVHAHGWFGQPALTRRNTNGLWTFVNRRFIRDRNIHGAIRVAYQGLIDRGRHPVVVLFLDTPPDTVDVNVHPMKTEVRFHEASNAFRAVRRAIHQSLAAAPWVAHSPHDPHAPAPDETDAPRPRQVFTEVRGPGSFDPAPSQDSARLPFRGEPSRAYNLSPSRPYSPAATASSGRAPTAGGHRADGGAAAPPDGPSSLPADAVPGEDPGRHFFSNLHYIGHFRGTYLLATDGRSLIVVDQHAAHERITYEDLRASWASRAVEQQPLLLPSRIRLDSLRAATLLDSLEFFTELGFDIEPFGGTDFALKAVPALLARARHDALVRDTLDELGDTGNSVRIDEARDAIISRMACHGSVRAGDTLTREEVMALFARMDRIDFGGNCPHGRPVYFLLGLEEIEQRFDRR